MRPIGTAPELERRRTRAVELLNQGESPSVSARILGVRRTSLHRWKKMAQASPGGLAAKPHPGPKPRLTAEPPRAQHMSQDDDLEVLRRHVAVLRDDLDRLEAGGG